MRCIMKQLNGLLEFNNNYFWSSDILGKSFNFTFFDIPCTIYFPILDEKWNDNFNKTYNYLNMPLVFSIDKSQTGGIPVSYPEGISIITNLLMKFSVSNNNFQDVANIIFDKILNWKSVLYKYLKLVSKIRIYNYEISINNMPLQLFLDTKPIKYNNYPTLYGKLPSNDDCINSKIFEKSLSLTSSRENIPLHYELLYNAYIELENNNYRNSVIDAATCLDTLLVQRINTEFSKRKIDFGDDLLKKYSMINGKIELLKILKVTIPTKDYQSKILGPRNKAIHTGDLLNKKIANEVIIEVEKFLDAFDPL